MEQRLSHSLWNCTASGPDGQVVRLQSARLAGAFASGKDDLYTCARRAMRSATLAQDTTRLCGDLLLTPARVRACSVSAR